VVGYTPDLVAGVWIGNSDGSPMRDVQSAAGAGRIWRTFMDAALADVPARPFTRPADVVQREVCKLSGLLPTAECPERIQAMFTPANLPSRPDDLYRRVEVCKVNGKAAFDRVPSNAREARVFVVFPSPDTEWGPKNGFPAPPSQRCDDVYRGVQVAKIDAPGAETPVSGTVQIAGSAMMDDFHHLDLEIGAGATPTVWTKITEGRTEGVDRALLGVWDTSRYPAGRYTLRLNVYDSVGNAINTTSPVIVGAAASPVPVGSPAPLVPSLIAPVFGQTPVPTPGGQPQQPPTLVPPALGPRTPTPIPGASPVPSGPAVPPGQPGTPGPNTRFGPAPPTATPALAQPATPTPRRR